MRGVRNLGETLKISWFYRTQSSNYNFRKSEYRDNLRYKNYIGDDDTNSYSKVVESKPYEDRVVLHIQKR